MLLALNLIELLLKLAKNKFGQALLMSMTMDSITKVGFGVHASSSGGSSGGGSYMDFAEAFDTVNACICRRYVNVWWKLHKWLRMGTEGALYRELHNINTFAANLISQHRHHANTTKPHAHAHGHDDPHITPHASVNHRDNTKDHDSSEDANDVRMCVCMYVCMYVRTYVCVYVVCMYVGMYVLCTYVCMYVCML